VGSEGRGEYGVLRISVAVTATTGGRAPEPFHHPGSVCPTKSLAVSWPGRCRRPDGWDLVRLHPHP